MSIPEPRLTELRQELRAAIDAGDKARGTTLAQAALAEGITPVDFFLEVIQPCWGTSAMRSPGSRSSCPS